MKRFKIIFLLLLIFCLFLLVCNFLSRSNAQTEKNLPTDCVICAQFVLECGENEVLIPQTCEKCAHCEPLILPEAQDTPKEKTIEISNCQKCTFHAQCPEGSKCVNDCCELKPRKQRKYSSLKKPPESSQQQEIKKQTLPKAPVKKPAPKPSPTAKVTPVQKKVEVKAEVKEKDIKYIKCKMPCGTKCCKQGESCITLSQCKGKKSCHLPVLRICTKKKPEPLSGGAVSF